MIEFVLDIHNFTIYNPIENNNNYVNIDFNLTYIDEEECVARKPTTLIFRTYLYETDYWSQNIDSEVSYCFPDEGLNLVKTVGRNRMKKIYIELWDLPKKVLYTQHIECILIYLLYHYRHCMC